MRVFLATEGENCWLPEVQIEDFPENLPAAVTFLAKSGQLGVRFDGVAGSIGLRTGDLIHVRPKIGDVNFLKLVTFTAGGKSLIEKFEQSTRHGLDDGGQIAPLFASEFLERSHQTLRTGLQHARSWQRITGRELQGQVDYVLTQQRIAVMQDKPVVSKVKQRTFDTPENRLTSLALVAVEGLLDSGQVEELRFVRRRWPCPPPTMRQVLQDIDVVQRRTLTNHYRGVRSYYRELIGLAQVVLGLSGLGFGSELFLSDRSYLVNTARVFEAFVLRAVQDAFSGLDVVVTKGGSDFRSLYVDGSFELVPDVVVERAGRCVMVMDAKYKTPTSGDHYQMMSYIENFGVKCGALIKPALANEVHGVEKFKSLTGRMVSVVRLDLTDIQEAVSEIQDFVRSFS